jgi:hypothetical protein
MVAAGRVSGCGCAGCALVSGVVSAAGVGVGFGFGRCGMRGICAVASCKLTNATSKNATASEELFLIFNLSFSICYRFRFRDEESKTDDAGGNNCGQPSRHPMHERSSYLLRR